MSKLTQTARRFGRWFGHSSASEADRRRNPRLPRRLLVQVAGLELYSTNITPAGLQLSCPVLWMPQLRAGANLRALETTILLPDQQQVRALSEVVYLYDYDDEFLVGVVFKAFGRNGAAIWQDYTTNAYVAGRRPAVNI